LIEAIGSRKGSIIPEIYGRSEKVCGLHMRMGEFERKERIGLERES